MATLPGLTFSAPGVPLYAALGAIGTQSTNSFANTYLWEGADISTNSVEFDLSAASTSRIIIGAEGTLFATLTLDGGLGNLEIATAGAVNIPTALNVSSLSTFLVDTESISTSKIDLDGQVLTADANDLLLNGIPVATISSLSSIADWALEPAISTVQMAGNNLIDGGEAYFETLETSSITTSSISGMNGGFQGVLTASTLQAFNGVFNDISTNTFTAFSTVSVVSTISSLVLEAQLMNTSTLFATAFLSTPDIEVSTINGATFGTSSIVVEVVGVSTLIADSISSVGAVLQEALVSTLQFNPSFSPNLDVNLGLGSLFGQLAGAASGGLSLAVSGAALGTGIAALAQGRQTSNINSNSYELVNGTTQLQISTLGTPFSTVYRFVSSVSETTPGEEYFISTVHPPGVCIRSLSDPLNTVSAPTSTIQSFGQWVALEANLPIPSSVSTYQQLFTSSLGATNIDNRIYMTSEMWFSTSINLDGGGNGDGITGGDLTNWQNLNCGTVFTDAIAGLVTPYIDIFTNIKNDGHQISTSELLVSSINGLPVNPLPSTVSTFQTASISSATISSINGSVFPQPVVNSFLTASISSATISTINGGIPFTTANPPSVFDASTILLSTLGSIGGTSSISITPNATASMVFDAGGDILTAGRSYFLQCVSSTQQAELLVDATSGAPGGQFRLAAGTIGNLNASSIRISTNQLEVKTISSGNLFVSSINSQPVAHPFRGGQFYRTTNQNLPVSANFLTFTNAKPWNSSDFVQVDSSTFTCSTTGTYQVAVNTTINAGSGLWTSLNKSINIEQDRSGGLRVVVNTCAVELGNYGQSVSAVIDIDQGDELRFITTQTLTSGSTISLGLSGTIDYNTFWDYQLLRS